MTTQLSRPIQALRRDSLRDREEEGPARCLGWFSVGLGLAEMLTPRGVARAIGVENDGALLPAMGLRELVTGIGILGKRRPAEWMWTRVVGDIMDLAYLANAMMSEDTDKGKLAAAAVAVAGVTALDLFCAQQLSARPARGNLPEVEESGIRIRPSITVNARPDELYRFWRNFENLPRILRHLESVTVDGNRSHWKATGPMGKSVEWDAEMTEDVPNERIAWRSLPDSQIANAGSVSFRPAPGRRGTVVAVDMHYEPPAGTLGAVVAFLFGKEPRQQIIEDLRAYKAFVETGEVPTISGQTSGRK